jgi:sialidase-1
MKFKLLLLFVFVWIAQTNYAQTTYLFKNHKEGYNMYRIPTIVITKGGKLLAFCEGRNNLFDGGDIDLVMKTSTDSGKTWGPLKVIWNDGKNTCGNPVPIVDALTGDVVLVASLNNQKVVVLRSIDEGQTWGMPQDITAAVKSTNWDWYATGPVHGIQLQDSAYKNRMVVPCNHTIQGQGKHIAHIIYSDDAGKSWQVGGAVPDDKTDECTAVELDNGNLLLNMRNNGGEHCRKTSISTDGGQTWGNVICTTTLPEPVCQGAMLRYKKGLFLFTNPAHSRKRKNLSLYTSTNGINWVLRTVICRGKSAYSDMVALPNGKLLCIYETGKLWPYSGVVYTVIGRSVFSD